MKHIRGFLLSLAFAGLALLAFNPHWVVKIQERVSPAPKDRAETPLKTVKPETPKLPKTTAPNLDNLPRLEGFEKIAKQDPWIGAAPCSIDIFDAPKMLIGLGERENGPLLTQPITATDGQVIVNQPTFLFKSQSGITLKLVQPSVQYYEVSGRRYREAKKDIFDRRPLEKMRQSENDDQTSASDDRQERKNRVTRAADIYSPSTLSYTVSGSRSRYRIVKNKTVMTSAFLVTLPHWGNYEAASKADQAKWDNFFCNVAHHELGHLRIRLDILAQTLDGYASLPPAGSSEEMKDLIIEYRKDISARVQDRQDAYHIYNDGGLRRGMTELPYAQLPFPWLEKPRTAEQSPTQLSPP